MFEPWKTERNTFEGSQIVKKLFEFNLNNADWVFFTYPALMNRLP